MSKKRKTRRQKEIASVRHAEQIEHIPAPSPTYSVANIKKESPAKREYTPQAKSVGVSLGDREYLRKDIISISAASGIILAFDIFLLVLLNSGAVKLNFLGY